MPTLLDDIKLGERNPQKLHCEDVFEHINNCQVCKKIYTPSSVMGGGFATVSTASSFNTNTSAWVIVIILAMLVCFFIYRKFVYKKR